MNMEPQLLPAHRCLSEPELAFHPEREQDRHVHPLKGLVEYGPYSRSLVYQVTDPIRVATIVPYGFGKRLDSLFAEMEGQHVRRERREYLIDYPGFSRVFGLRVVRAPGSSVHIELGGQFDAEIARAPKPHVLLAERLTQAISAIQAQRSEFNVLIIVLPDRWKAGFFGGPNDDFDLHDYIKGVTASKGIPTQIVLERGALSYFCRASVMWRLGIAMYCKAGGIPWKLAHTEPDTAYIGLSYALRPNQAGNTHFVTCCSQVFDADGASLEFVAYDTGDIHQEGKNPFMNRAQMLRVMSRSLTLYQQRHAGRTPRRVVIHKTTEFKPEEVDGCFDAWQAPDGLDLVQIQQDVAWRGVHTMPDPENSRRARPSAYPCWRGSYMQLGGRDVLLWTQGDAPAAVSGRNYFKEGKGIPSPLLLTRHAGHGAWEDGCRSVLGLTKMNWNNDALYDRLPVTLGYASTLAKTLKRMPQLHPQPYQFRFFM